MYVTHVTGPDRFLLMPAERFELPTNGLQNHQLKQICFASH